jgi:cell division protein ZipA
MNIHNLIIFGFLFVVAAFAAAVIYRHRQRTKVWRDPAHESQGHTTERDLDDFDQFVDPIVAGSDTAVTRVDTATGVPVIIKSNIAALSKVQSAKQNNETKTEPQAPIEKPKRAPAEQFFPNDIIAFTLRANPGHPYAAYEFLQALLSCGFRFGKMGIFHRYQNANMTGDLLFSLSSAVAPGTFEMTRMGEFVTPALYLFMRISLQADVSKTFDLMLETAHQLIDDLGGEILDDKREPITDEKIDAIRDKIIQYEQSQHTADLFAG